MCLIRRRVRSAKASLSGRQLSSSTPTPKWPVTSAISIKAMYSPNTKVNELLSFGEDEQMSHHWRLNLCELLAEVLYNDVVQTSSELDRFLPNQFEALIKCRLNFVCYEDSGFQSLFYIWTLGNFAELFENRLVRKNHG